MRGLRAPSTRAVLVVGIASSACSLLLDTSDANRGADPPAGASDAGPPDASMSEDAAAPPGDAYRAAVLADSPLAYFRFGEPPGARVCANEVPGSPVTCAYPATEVTLGVPAAAGTGACLQSRSAAIVAAGPLDFPNDAPFAFEGWVKLDALGSSERLFMQMNNPNSTSRSGTWLLKFAAEDELTSQTWDEGVHLLWTSKVGGIVAGTYMHIVVTHSDRDYLFVDGAEATGGIKLAGRTRVVSGAPLEWGGFLGCVDEVAIYDKALSPAQISRHFAALPR